MRFLFCLWLVALGGFAQSPVIEGDRLRAHIRFLANDLLEGRSVGTPGGQLAVQYLASAFEAAGAKGAAPGGSFLQRVPLVGVKVAPTSQLTLGNQTLQWHSHFIASTHTQEASVTGSAPLVFVGHGIRAPEFQWDDYAGIDVKGKVVVLFTGEPPSDDPAFFDGKALTYFGRWTYKFEEAARQGALGALLIHTNETASYGWNVVQNSWSGENIQLERNPSSPALRLAAWVHSDSARAAGLPVDDLLRAADTRGFTPTALATPFRFNLNSAIRKIESHNVAAIIPGSDPTLSHEHIIYSAHWDHLSKATSGEDRIYNGAVDNATGCAMLIELARSWASLSPRPRRTVLFLAVTAEESGLLGSRFYTENPLLPIASARLNINLDGIIPGGKPAGLMALGVDKTNAWPLIEEAARRYSLPLRSDPNPAAGWNFRSDHFSFVRAGVSAFSLIPVDVPGDFAQNYTAKHYHQPSDEYSPSWDLTSNEILARLALTLGLNAASRP